MSKKNVLPNEGFSGFDWPEFKNDRDRIKAYSKRYKNMSVIESIAAHYNMKFNNNPERPNYTPTELKVGEIIDAKILSIDKGRVVFDTFNQKADFQSCINLYKYEKFKHFLPMYTIRVEVTKIDKNKVVVDPLSPMLNEWLQPILKDTSIQKVTVGGQNFAEPIMVKDLQLVNGGFMGKAIIPNVSKFVGEDYVMDAFIPGSQIVLNITDNFEQFIGKSVPTFVMNYMSKPGGHGEMSLICSAKEVIKFEGELNMIHIFNSWCEESDLWKQVANTIFEGKVTGVINSSKKCGVFIEIPELSITGMVSVKPEELVNYKPHMCVPVKIAGFDEETYFDQAAQQIQHVVPYEIEDGILKKCNLKPILQFDHQEF